MCKANNLHLENVTYVYLCFASTINARLLINVDISKYCISTWLFILVWALVFDEINCRLQAIHIFPTARLGFSRSQTRSATSKSLALLWGRWQFNLEWTIFHAAVDSDLYHICPVYWSPNAETGPLDMPLRTENIYRTTHTKIPGPWTVCRLGTENVDLLLFEVADALFELQVDDLYNDNMSMQQMYRCLYTSLWVSKDVFATKK